MHALKEALRPSREIPMEGGGSRWRDSLPCFGYCYVRFKKLEVGGSAGPLVGSVEGC